MVCAYLLPLFAHIHCTFAVAINMMQGIRGCHRNSSGVQFSTTFILLFGFQLGLSLETESCALIDVHLRTRLPHNHTCRTEVAGGELPSVRCPSEA